MAAATSSHAGPDAIRALVSAGAYVDAPSHGMYEGGHTALSLAVQFGDPDKVAALLEAGASPHYCREGYDVLLDAVLGRDIFSDSRLLSLLSLLVERGARLDGNVTRYQESPLRMLSRCGRFDAVDLLLKAGADGHQLQWTALMHAIALGALNDMTDALTSAEELEARDFWRRTPLLLAIMVGDLDKVRWLLERGARRDVSGRCGTPPLFYAIATRNPAMLRLLLDEGFSIGQCDEFGNDALTEAAESGSPDLVRELISRGLDPNGRSDHTNPLYRARDPDIARALLDLDADPAHLQDEAQLAISRPQCLRDRGCRSGTIARFSSLSLDRPQAE